MYLTPLFILIATLAVGYPKPALLVLLAIVSLKIIFRRR